MASTSAHLTSRERHVLSLEGTPARDVAVRLLMPVGEVLEFRHRLRALGFAA